MEIRWNYEKLAGNKDYEELRTLVNSYERQAYTKLQLFLKTFKLMTKDVFGK